MPGQYFDWTKGGRERSFFGGGVAAHVSTAQPVSNHLVEWVAAQAGVMGIKLHRDVTYACVEGPRLGTRAESLFMRQVGCHLVGMTNVPRCSWRARRRSATPASASSPTTTAGSTTLQCMSA
jgi:5'-methylthioadenosine phosphorylase